MRIMAPVRIGVIGVGFGATVHIPAFQSEGMEVVAVCASRQERADEAAQRFGIPNAHTDYQELVARADIDAVSVVTAPRLHHEMTVAALNAGKHVICEKPFTVNAAQAEELVAKADETGLTTMIAHEFRFAPERAFARQLIDEGYIGAPQHITASLHLRFARRPGAAPIPPNPGSGGMLGGLGSHYIDGIRHWFGDVTGVSGTLHGSVPEGISLADANNGFSVHMTFENGAWGTLTCSLNAPLGQGGSVQIYGSEGSLHLSQTGPNPAPEGLVRGGRLDDESRELRIIPIPEELHPFDDARDHRLLAFRLMVRDFLRGIETGTSPTPNFRDGLGCQRVLDAIQQSHATGSAVDVAAG